MQEFPEHLAWICVRTTEPDTPDLEPVLLVPKAPHMIEVKQLKFGLLCAIKDTAPWTPVSKCRRLDPCLEISASSCLRMQCTGYLC